MKNMLRSLLVLTAFLFAVPASAQTDSIAVELAISCTNGTTVIAFQDTILEGDRYTVQPFTLTGSLASAQPLYNALVGSSFQFEPGSLNENIKVRLNISNINCGNGLYNPDSLLGNLVNFFMFLDIRVYDFQGIIPKPSPYNFNSPNNFQLTIKKTPAFYSFLSTINIPPSVLLAIVYYLGNGQYSSQGINTVVNNADSLVIEAEHFSKFAGGDRSVLVDVKEVTSSVPQAFELSQNFPNPFNPTTVINFSVPEQSFIELKVHNVLGSEVAVLASGVYRPGTYQANFDAATLPAGIYFYTLKTDRFSQTRKMILLK